MRTAEAWVLGYVLNSLWQVPLLLAAAWLAARVLRPLGAAAEHRVWVTALLLGSVLPAGYLPPWSWFSIRTWLERIGGSRGGNTHVSVVMGAATGAGAVHLPATLLSAAVLVYGAVCAWFLLRFAWRWTRLASLRREATELILTGDNARAWADCSVRFGAEGVAVASSPSLFAPVTLGFRSRLILLPERLTRDVADADLPVVIAHELAHIRRNDFVKNLLYELLTLPVSYHPAFQITRERVIETREMVCDEMAAVLTGRNPYARSLLRLASLLVAGMPARIPHAIGIFDAHTFERRIMRLTEKRAEVRSVRRLATLIACAALGIATCGSALALHLRVNGLAAMGAAAEASGPIHVKGNIMQGQRISGEIPQYPPEAKKKRVQGTVVIDALIDQEGKVGHLNVVSGPEMLRQSSLDAVKTWVYKPYLLNGEPVAVETTINVVYSLGDSKHFPPPPPPGK